MSEMDSALGLIDAANAATTVEAPVTETQTQTEEIPSLDTPEEGSGKTEESTEHKTEEQQQTEEKTPEQIAEEEKQKAEENAWRTMKPDAVRKALKEFRDADPKNVAAVKALHNAYERWNVAKDVFPTVNEMKAAKEFITNNGGSVQAAQQMFESVKETDQLLYNAGDDIKHADELWSNVIDDLKNEGKLEALPNLAHSLLAHLEQAAGGEAFAEVALPVIARGLTESGATKALNSAWTLLNKNDVAGAKEVLRGLGAWMTDVLKRGGAEQQEEKQLTKLETEKKAWAETKQREFQTDIGKEALKTTSHRLGQDLKPILATVFAKSLGKPALQAVAGRILQKTYEAMQADKTLQTQLKAQWGQKNPNRAEILRLTSEAVEKIAKTGLVRQVFTEMYPAAAKAMTPAAARVAARDAKTAADKATNAAGKPVFVVSKPQWDSIDWSKDPHQHLYITGKCYLKGSGKLVTWRR